MPGAPAIGGRVLYRAGADELRERSTVGTHLARGNEAHPWGQRREVLQPGILQRSFRGAREVVMGHRSVRQLRALPLRTLAARRDATRLRGWWEEPRCASEEHQMTWLTCGCSGPRLCLVLTVGSRLILSTRAAAVEPPNATAT